MAEDKQSKRIDIFPPVPRADAQYTRRLSGLFGTKSAFGRSIRALMNLAGILPERKEAPERERGRELLDRTAAETFLNQAEAAKTQYAQTQSDAQAALQSYEALTGRAREQLGTETQEGLLSTLAEIYRALKSAQDVPRIATEVRTALSNVLQRAPARVRTEAQGGGGQRRRAA